MLAVAKGYRERHLPADVIVVDWLYYTKMGQMDFVPDLWPDPAAMNQQLHQMGFQTMISVWPRFEPGSRYYDFVLQKGWFEHLADGTPTNGLPYDKAGSDIDTTNPDAAHWYWDTIKENILSKGFDSHLGRRDRARSASERQLPEHRPRHAVLQRLSALSHRRALLMASAATRRIAR